MPAAPGIAAPTLPKYPDARGEARAAQAASRAAADIADIARSLGGRVAARLAAREMWAELARLRAGTSDATTVAELRASLEAAADALAAAGDAWDASRLPGQAALDEPDPTAARGLLEAARTLATESIETTDQLVAAGLSEREAEVARLVAVGRTHKEVGAQLYISPKTVEHHVAKIRQRLGAGSRAELLATIRELTDT